MKKNLFCLLLSFVPLFFCAAQVEEGMAGRLSSISSSLSAAHVSLAPGTRIRVTNLETGRSIAVIVSRRLGADSTHIVELTAPVADAIGMRDEARVRVELLNSGGTSAAASGSSQGGTGTAESRDNRETAAAPGRRDAPGAEGTSREPVALPPVRVSQARKDAVTEQETKIENGGDSREFYYINSYEGEYPGDPEDAESPEPPLSRESGPSQGDIVTLPPETDQSAPPPVAPPPRRRPVPPSPADPPPPAQAVSPAPPSPADPPSPAQAVPPVSPSPAAPPSPAQTVPPASPPAVRPAQPAVPPAQPRPAPPVRPAQPAAPPAQTPPTQARPAPPASPPQPGSGTASARVALPADTDRVVLSMSRDESGKLWVYVESETAREIAITEVPRPAPIQAPVPDRTQPRTVPRQAHAPPYRVQTPPSVQVQAPPPPPPPAPQRRRVTVKVIPRLPPPGDGKRYILQVGSYRDRGTAEYRLFKLQNAGIDAVMEPHDTAIRIIINGVYAEEIPALAEKLGKSGVTEIWVRER